MTHAPKSFLPLIVLAALTSLACSTPTAPASSTAPGALSSTPPGTNPRVVGCSKAIASRQEGDKTVVYITLSTGEKATRGETIRCRWPDQRVSPACLINDIVDGGMLEGFCDASTATTLRQTIPAP